MSSETTIELCTSVEPVDKVTCSLCRRQFAKYTCPTCNVPYCSLTCFGSRVRASIQFDFDSMTIRRSLHLWKAHNRCSETFYKKEIETEIHAEPSKNAQERQKMLELLKNFEEESVVDQTSLEDEDDVLVRRFGAVDLDSTTPDALWAMLTSAERLKFITALNNPTGELAQQLLTSESIEKEIQDPWWETLRSNKDDDQIQDGAKPRIMEVPISMINLNPTGRHPLVYNICSILISYAYITRHLGISSLCSLRHQEPEYSEARRLVSRLVPFLTDRKSTKLYPNLTVISTEFWSAFHLGAMTNELFSLLLRDAAFLLTPLLVTELMSSTANSEAMVSSHSHSTSVLALSDLHDMFSIEQNDDKERTGRRRGNHVTHKLIFYAAQILSTPSDILCALAREMIVRAEMCTDRRETTYGPATVETDCGIHCP